MPSGDSLYYQDDYVTIWHQDCRDMGDALLGRAVLVIADYPFKMDVDLAQETSNRAWELLVDGGNFLVINNPHNMFKTTHCYSGFTLRNSIALIKSTMLTTPYHLGFKHNYALMLCKGSPKSIWNGNKVRHEEVLPDVIPNWRPGYRNGKHWHPEAIPLKWAITFVSLLSNAGDVVVDFFVGSGTFAVASERLKRHYYGCELEERYCEIAAKRVRGLHA